MRFSWTNKFRKPVSNIFDWGSMSYYDSSNTEVMVDNFIKPPTLVLFDENGTLISSTESEYPEQCLSFMYINPDSVVLELGARYGSVSCIINKKLKNKNNQVSVEPDSIVWSVLEDNLARNHCSVNIHKGFISKKSRGLLPYGYAATSYITDNTSIPSVSVEDIEQMYDLKFDTLVADCEGFLEEFFDEHPHLYDQLKTVIFEADYPNKCNYAKIRTRLKDHGFQEVIYGFQNVYQKI
jgi:FkbM family methyltransferase